MNKNDLGAWFRDDCYTQLKFICERKQAAFVVPTPTPNPDSTGNCKPGMSRIKIEIKILFMK